ncbi:MAG: aspartate-semialdehyde dehydrogenase [Planctomycetes bacterium]|nr:aspartate-semialdehyde dehydrogenase [Planctomycetota bacterium]
MSDVNVAIAGATGAVGEEFLRLLALRNYPIRSLRLLASARSAGKKLKFNGEDVVVEELKSDSFKGIDHAFFSAGGSISKEFAPHAAKAGAVIIDNTSAFRYDAEVPLVIPEINPQDAFEYGERRIIANPNCTTIVALLPTYPLHKQFTLKRAIMSSYQAISGAGAQAMEELQQQMRDWAAGKELTVKHQPKQIAFNVIPRIDAIQDNGYTKEEMKFLWEGRKIMHHDALRATATCVRVPVLRSHAVSLTLEFEKPCTPQQAREILGKAPGVIVQDDPKAEIYPIPLERSMKDEIGVGRIRQDVSVDDNRGLCLWAVGDQIMKGAALNAIQIGELLLKK